jgi:hypothetical protein
MGDMSEDLEGHYQVQESKIVNHFAYDSPVLMTRFGWAKHGHQTKWYETKIESLKNKLEENT